MSRTIAEALAQIVELLCLLTQGRAIELNLNTDATVPEGFILLPRKMTQSMIAAARHHNWSDFSHQHRIQEMWASILYAAEKEVRLPSPNRAGET